MLEVTHENKTSRTLVPVSRCSSEIYNVTISTDTIYLVKRHTPIDRIYTKYCGVRWLTMLGTSVHRRGCKTNKLSSYFIFLGHMRFGSSKSIRNLFPVPDY